jgi:uracil-DNA glycosylase
MVSADDSLVSVTRDILACRQCRRDPETFHDGKTVLAEPWTPPSGWAGNPGGHVELLLVALNPGFPLPGEPELPDGLTEDNVSITSEQALAVTQSCLRHYREPKRHRDWIFHRKSVALARALLWLNDGSDPGETLWSRCWFTDVFKCSTRKESNPTLTQSALRACRRHLEREIRCTQPTLVVALGNRAWRGLVELQVDRLVKFRHPSNGCPRLDATYHDAAFGAAAKKLSVEIPSNFRRVRKDLAEEALR